MPNGSTQLGITAPENPQIAIPVSTYGVVLFVCLEPVTDVYRHTAPSRWDSFECARSTAGIGAEREPFFRAGATSTHDTDDPLEPEHLR